MKGPGIYGQRPDHTEPFGWRGVFKLLLVALLGKRLDLDKIGSTNFSHGI
jgi:hypothetical protein